MAWSPEFLSALDAQPYRFVFVLQVWTSFQEPGDSAYSISNVASYGTARRCRIARQGIRTQGATLSPRGWSTTIGSFSVDFVGDLGELAAHMTKGSTLILKAGLPGWAPHQFQWIGQGVLRSIRGVSPRWTLDCLDLLSALGKRLSTDFSGLRLFSSVPGVFTTSAKFYAPPSSSIETTGTLGAFDADSAGTGAIRITPTSGSDPFYLTWTGTATGPSRFTGLSSSGLFGTVPVPAGAGSRIDAVGYSTGHPLDIARRICVRTGLYATLPLEWTLGMRGEQLDHSDINLFRDNVAQVSTGSYTWDIFTTDEISDGFSWLTGLLSAGGFFPTMRQGLLTWRAARGTHQGLRPVKQDALHIRDADISRVLSYDAWDVGHEPEYSRVAVSDQSGVRYTTPSGALATGQGDTEQGYDLSAVLFSNETQIATETADRVWEAGTRVPERLVVECAGLRLAQLTPGDQPLLTTTRTHSRRDGADGWQSRRVTIDEVSPAWAQDKPTVRIGMLIYPESDAVYA